MKAYFSLSSKDNLFFYFLRNVPTGFKIVISKFELRNLNDLGFIAIIVKQVFAYFHTFLGITQKSLNISEIWLFQMEEHKKIYQNRLPKVNNYFFGQIDRFTHCYFFGKSGQGGLGVIGSANVILNTYPLLSNEGLLFPVS